MLRSADQFLFDAIAKSSSAARTGVNFLFYRGGIA